jgi:hypothetical protein
MSDVAILTAIYDSYDELKPALPQAGVEVDWVFVTDDPVLGAKPSHLGWRVVYEPRPDVHPNRAAKHPKYRPWEYSGAPASIWVDASFRIVSQRFAVDAVAHADPIAQFAHPWRACLFDEAKESAGLAKYAGEPVMEQAESYREAGHPEGWGLWATGVIARQHTEAVRKMGWLWLAETYRWSFQDQISQPFALREKGLRPTAFPGSHLATPWLAYEGSARH